MSIDRRIVSILYFNGIMDVEEVQEFLGEKNGFYEILINDEVKKLKIPSEDETIFTQYDDELEKEIISKRIEEIKDSIKEVFEEVKENIKEEVKEKVEDIKEEVKEEVKEKVENIKDVLENIKDDVKDFLENDEDIKEEKMNSELEGEEIKIIPEENPVEEVQEIVKKPNRPKKLKIIESKDDIDDFINLA